MKRSTIFVLSFALACALFPAVGVASSAVDDDVLPVSDFAAEDGMLSGEDDVATSQEGAAFTESEGYASSSDPESSGSMSADGAGVGLSSNADGSYALNAVKASIEEADRDRDIDTLAAVQNVTYLDASGAQKTCPEAIEVVANENEWTSGWYVVGGTVDVTERFVVKGDVKLILANGCMLSASKGITVPEGNSLTIYAQSTIQSQAGTLDARGSGSAGIGGHATYRDDPDRNCGSVTINGGNVSVQGSAGCAGIGGAAWANAYGYVSGNFGTIAINGGWVNAKGAAKSFNEGAAAAIGGSGGGSGGTIRITGGTITVEPYGVWAAGIGGGQNGMVGTIVVSGGHIVANVNSSATSDRQSPCIGNTMTLSTGSEGTAFIETNDRDFIGNDWGFTSGIVLNDGNLYIRGNQTLSGDTTIESGKVLQLYSSASLTIPAGVTLTNDNIIKSNANTTLVVDGRIVNNGAIENNGGLIKGTGTLEGDKAAASKPPAPTVEAVGATSVTLKVMPDAGYGPVEYTRTAGGGAPVGWQSSPTFNSLNSNTEYTFYTRYIGNEFYTEAWSDGTAVTTQNYRVFYVDAGGTRVRTPADENVVRLSPSYLANNPDGLASGWYVVEEDMAIDTAHVLVREGADVHLILADGIRMSCGRGIIVPSRSSLSIYGQSSDDATAGTLLATGSGNGSAIGGSYPYTCGSISINSGTVMARGGYGAAGIGAGRLQKVGTIEINGGFVRAFGGDGGCGIGGGTDSSTGSVSISGGTVEAVGKNAPAIGTTGRYAQDLRVTITGGTLRLVSSGGEAVIGGSQDAKVSLAMEGGLVYGVGDAHLMTNCAPFDMTGGAMVFADNGSENAPMTDHELAVNDPAIVTVAAFMQGIQVPAGTTVTDSPTITLPAGQQASFVSTKGEQVAITSASSTGPMHFRQQNGLGAVFLPAGFVAKVGNGGPIVSPRGGMWLLADGTMEGAEGGGGSGEGADGGDAESGGAAGSGGPSNANAASSLESAGDGMGLTVAMLLAVMAVAGLLAMRLASVSPAKRAKHARR